MSKTVYFIPDETAVYQNLPQWVRSGQGSPARGNFRQAFFTGDYYYPDLLKKILKDSVEPVQTKIVIPPLEELYAYIQIDLERNYLRKTLAPDFDLRAANDLKEGAEERFTKSLTRFFREFSIFLDAFSPQVEVHSNAYLAEFEEDEFFDYQPETPPWPVTMSACRGKQPKRVDWLAAEPSTLKWLLGRYPELDTVRAVAGGSKSVLLQDPYQVQLWGKAVTPAKISGIVRNPSKNQ